MHIEDRRKGRIRPVVAILAVASIVLLALGAHASVDGGSPKPRGSGRGHSTAPGRVLKTRDPSPSPSPSLPPSSDPSEASSSSLAPSPSDTSRSSPSPSPSGTGPTLYVAPNGDDANDGSSSHPWATIQRGLQAAQPGDTIVVEAGSYAPASFVRGGTAAAPITLRADGSVTLNGGGSGVGLAVTGVSHVAVEGFEISNFDVGIGVSDASDVLVRGNTLRSNQSAGIQNWGVDRVDVVQNRLLDPAPPYPASAVQDYGVNFYYSTNVTANDNYFFGDHNQALSFKRQVVGGSATGNTFEGCMYTCIYVGQNDDDQYGDMTSSNITVSGNRMRPVTDPLTGIRYRVSQPIAVRNVTEALVANNVIDPSDLSRVNIIPSPQLSGLAAGNNTIRDNSIQVW